MKSLMIAALLGSLLAAGSWACGKGCTEFKDSCACDLAPAESAQTGPTVQPSDEVPGRHPEPAWQRGDVKIIDIPAFKTEAEEADAQLKYAHANGIPPRPSN